jgi:serpin B
MKFNSFFTVIICFVFFAVSCEKNNENNLPSDQSSEIQTIEKEGLQIITEDNAFGFDMFRQVDQHAEEGVNLLISPTSISIALAMTYNGAESATKDAMAEVLHKQGYTDKQINETYQALIENLKNSDPDVIFEIANAIWYKSGFPVKEDFLNINQMYYSSDARQADFSDPATVDKMNGWIEDHTNGLIQDMLDKIPPDAVMYLINALYFKGEWTRSFNEENTYSGNFYRKDGTLSSASYMKLKDTFNFYQDEQVKVLELPYGNKNHSMVIILPNDGMPVQPLVESMDTAQWNEWYENMRPTEVEVHIPKFKFGYKALLNGPLQDMGMGIAFSTGANFRRIADANLAISRVIHQTFIETNEQGTEAAAATIVEMCYTSLPSYEVFQADQPFIFAIRENNTGALVFLGKLMNPEDTTG